MDWESKFSSIVRETEANIAKVKHRLGTSRAATHLAMSINGTPPHSSLLDNNSVYGSDRYTPTYSALRPRGGSFSDSLREPIPSIADLSHISKAPSLHNENSVPFRENFSNSVDHSPAIVSLLQERLEVQNKTIENLTTLVKKQEQEKDHFQKQIKDLRNDLSVLSERVLEKGVDIQTERKIEQWKTEMRAEMQLLQSQIQLHNSKEEYNSLSSIQVAALVREVRDMKKFLKEEVDEFRREVEGFKRRLVKLEIESTSVSADSKDLQYRHDQLDRTIQDMNRSHQSQSRNLCKSQDDYDVNKMQLSELRNSMATMRDKVNNIENQVNRTGSESSSMKPYTDIEAKTAVPVSSHKITMLTSYDDLLSPATSDIDISESTDLGDYNSLDLSYTPKVLIPSRPDHENLFPVDVDLDLDDLDLSDAESVSFREINLDDL